MAKRKRSMAAIKAELIAGFDEFTKAYVEAALWSSVDDDGQPIDKNYEAGDFSIKALGAIIEDCNDFQESQQHLLALAMETSRGYTMGQAGHDFWLTRNRHGTGFWDRANLDKTLGTSLTDAAHLYRDCDLVVANKTIHIL